MDFFYKANVVQQDQSNQRMETLSMIDNLLQIGLALVRISEMVEDQGLLLVLGGRVLRQH